ncbi:MAG: DUF4214 domain-containing protein, partial [Singulisphaera sp.]|nr:DUF4214 domain-containing protein [Singulisphaera sp.]
SGNTFWLNELDRGVSRTTVANGFVTSTEASSDFVTTDGYQGILGRDPDSSGLSFWTTVLTGPTPSQTQQQVLVQFVVSSENTGRINTAIAAAPTETPGQIAQTLLNDTTFPLS